MFARPAITRRSLRQIGSVGLGGLTLPGVIHSAENSSQRPAPRVKACILLDMDGGPSQIDLFDLKAEASAEIRGPWQPITTAVEGVQIGELLPCLARQMHRVLFVRSVRHEETVHDPAVTQMLALLRTDRSGMVWLCARCQLRCGTQPTVRRAVTAHK